MGAGVPALGQNQSGRGWNTSKTTAGISSQTPSLKRMLVELRRKLQVVFYNWIYLTLFIVYLFICIYLFRIGFLMSQNPNSPGSIFEKSGVDGI